MIREICGCVHLHTTFSDGGCDYGKIVKAAGGAGLDYVCVTDHNTLEGRKFDGLQGGVFVLTGYEHNDKDNLNHYLALGADKVVNKNKPQDYINAIKKAGGAGFIAHPAEKRDLKELPPYPWTAWDAEGFDGIEIWNQMSDWMEQIRGKRNLLNKLVLPNRRIRNVPQDLLERWDEMNRARLVSAIGGVDAHTRKFRIGPLTYTIFPIKTELRGVRTHLFVDDKDWVIKNGDQPETAKKKRKKKPVIAETNGRLPPEQSKMRGALIDAMRNGKGFISNFSRGDARGCEFFLRDVDGKTELPGRPKNNLSMPVMMNIRLTQDAMMRLVRNGKVIRSKYERGIVWTITEPGVYRVEAHTPTGAWIYTNPFPVGKYPL